jgi:catechol 2,3-dioxygenase-like lactoylglutathione lyase family enzyme
MLASGKLIGFIPTTDYDRSRAFYEGKLGCTFISLDQFAMVLDLGGSMIRVVKIPNSTPSHATILGWQVTDVRSVAQWLTSRGVELEKYPFVEDKELGVWVTPAGNSVAWFKDPDGNVLSISSHDAV